MNETDVQQHAQRHADHVCAGNQGAIMEDIVPDALMSLAPVASALPSPVETADVQSVSLSGEEAVVRTRYAGKDKSVVVESHWAQRDGRPRIIDAKLV